MNLLNTDNNGGTWDDPELQRDRNYRYTEESKRMSQERACVAFLSIDLFLLNGLAVLPGVAAVFAEGVLLVLVSEVTLVVTLFVQACSIVFSHSIHLS